MGCLRTTENCYLYSAEELSLPRRQRQHFKGSNYSDHLGEIIADSWEDEDGLWMLSRKEKRLVHSGAKVEVGGSVAPGLPTANRFKGREKEPVFFHQKPWRLADELVYDYFGQSIVDLSPGAGSWAIVAVQRRLPYVAVCSSTDHVNGLQQYLVSVLQKHMSDSGHVLYAEEFQMGTKKPPNKRKAGETGDNKGGDKKPKGGADKNALLEQLQSLYGGGGEGGNGAENEGEGEDEGEPEPLQQD